MSDIDDPSLGLNKLLQSGSGSDQQDLEFSASWGEEIGSRFLGSWGCGCRLGCGIVCRWWCHGVERELGSWFF
ncbi:hypothetical protein PRUPE_1G174600 [Prunus persica]|uniref:Uncharacterized protein n=1 Tax=Prunus persica TaxID=3760 RepID=A0A251QYU2_PRUPE|nr:hypothetical protein PRUPE_1G174600 [Prunus persica]